MKDEIEEKDDPEIMEFIDAMMRGERFSEKHEGLAMLATMVYADSLKVRGRKRKAVRSCPVVKGKKERDELLDVIMENAYPSEDLEMSLSRVAKAAGIIGFKTLNAFTASCAYKTFPQLSEVPMK